MNKLLVITGALALMVLSFSAGTFYPAILNEEPMVQDYLNSNDRGCDEVLVNDVLGKPYCVVGLENEDDAVYIIKKHGSLDDYR